MSEATNSQAALRQMIDGYRISQMICVAAELGIADLLATGPKHVEQLAVDSGTHPRALFRLLRALASVGVFQHAGGETFSSNPLADTLRADAAGTLRPWARFSARLYRTWGHLDHSIKTGETAFDHIHGMTDWQYQEQNAEEGRIFNEAMTANTPFMSRAIVDAYDFSRFATVVDVGGGQGGLLIGILESNPRVRGMLFDLPAAIQQARAMLDAAGLAARCQLAAGTFLESIPNGGDAYILSRILHDWNDEDTRRILNNMRRAMADRGTLLIVERLLDAQNPAVEATLSDLNMMVRNGGRERTRAEFDGLLASTGFKAARHAPTRTPFHIIEAMPA